MKGFEPCGLELAELITKAMQTFSNEPKLLRACISMLVHFVGGGTPAGGEFVGRAHPPRSHTAAFRSTQPFRARSRWCSSTRSTP